MPTLLRKSVLPAAIALLVLPLAATSQESPLKVETLKAAPPEMVSRPIKEMLSSEGFRVLDGAGKPFIDIWFRKAVPASKAPGDAEGAILFPFLKVGELLGVARLAEEATDYRDQPIIPDVYTLRYGLQPVNGDHLGISTFRDYAMMLIAEEDQETAPKTQEQLDEASAAAAGSNHPAVFLLVAPPDGAQTPSAYHDEGQSRWGVILPVPLAVEGQDKPVTLPVQLIVVGHGPV